MLIFNTFFALLLASTTTLQASVASPSLEDSGTTKSVKRVGQDQQRGESSGKGRRSKGASGNQGQASSSAYFRNDFTIQVDVAADSRTETSNGQNNGGDASASHKDPVQHKFSTASGFSARPISASALSVAKAKHDLKKKLQAENKKKLQLHEVASETGPKDPREEIITELMKASQDIEK